MYSRTASSLPLHSDMRFNFFLCQGRWSKLGWRASPHDQRPSSDHTHKADLLMRRNWARNQLYELIKCPFSYIVIIDFYWSAWFYWWPRNYIFAVFMIVWWPHHDVSPNNDQFKALKVFEYNYVTCNGIQILKWNFLFHCWFCSRFKVNGFQHRDRPPYIHYSSMHKHLLVLDSDWPDPFFHRSFHHMLIVRVIKLSCPRTLRSPIARIVQTVVAGMLE